MPHQTGKNHTTDGSREEDERNTRILEALILFRTLSIADQDHVLREIRAALGGVNRAT